MGQYPNWKNPLKFCKRYLEISNKVSNVASRSELGRSPLIINIYKNILYYVLYLLRKNEDTIVKQAFRTSLELHCNGKNSFYHNLMKISEYYDLPDFDPNNLSEAQIKYCIGITSNSCHYSCPRDAKCGITFICKCL